MGLKLIVIYILKKNKKNENLCFCDFSVTLTTDAASSRLYLTLTAGGISIRSGAFGVANPADSNSELSEASSPSESVFTFKTKAPIPLDNNNNNNNNTKETLAGSNHSF